MILNFIVGFVFGLTFALIVLLIVAWRTVQEKKENSSSVFDCRDEEEYNEFMKGSEDKKKY